MLRSSLRLALRTLRRRLSYTLISGVGLTVALACAGLVGAYLWFETSYDTFHEDAEDIGRIYRIQKEDPYDQPYPRMQGLVGRQLQDRVTGIEHVTALHNLYRTVQLRRDAAQGPSGAPGPTGPDARLEIPNRGAFFVPAGDDFFDVFSGFEVIRGDAATALEAPGQAVLTRSAAQRLFGTVDVVGRTVALDLGTSDISPYEAGGRTETLTVRAVTADVPARSHFSYELIYSVAPSSLARNWSGAYTYVELAPGADRAAILDQVMPVWDGIATLGDTHFSDRYYAVFEPLTDIHLATNVGRPLGQPTDVRYLWALGLLALVVLLVAGANYTNLAAAMYAGRSREVGARKAIGAYDGQVARQFVFESVVLALLCAPLAMGLASALTPAFNRLMDTQLPILGAAPLAWAGLMAGAAVLGAVAGVYPAWGVARRSVPSLFEGSSFGRGQGLTVRRGLVVAQFALFIALGSAAVLMQQQMTFLQSQDLGFRPSGLVEITNGGALTSSADPDRSYLDRRTVSQSQAFQRELAQSPLVEAVTSGRTFLSEQQSGPQFRRDGNPSAPTFRATWSALNPDAPRVIGLTPRAGAYFDRPLEERRDSVALVNPQALDRRTVSQSQAFQRELAQSPLVEAVTSGRTFLSEQQSGPQFRRDGNPSAPTFRATWSALNPDAPRVIGLTPRAGAYFDRPLGERRDSVALVNPQALDRLGCDADDLADCRVYTDWSDRLAGVPVVGVVENARFSSLRYGADPLILFLFDQASRRGSGRHDLFVRFRDGVSRDQQGQLIEATWDRFLPGRSVEYEVLTERIDAFYAQDQRLRTLGLSLAGVALVLVVLGLLAITAYLTRLRLKEVAIRKALGASVTSILALLNREFVGLVGVAFVFGSTAGYFAMREWLAGFATRIDVSPVVFLAVGAGALAIAVLAVSVRSLPAARLNPAQVLQSPE